MDSGEYFDRVVRFLETKGWNTARSRIGTDTYVVTGTRESDTYYDRMLTLVAVAEGATLSRRHVEYLVEAGAENDVDHLLATARGGITDDADTLADEHDVTVLETETIDDAFIDGFSTGEEFDDGRGFGDTLAGRGPAGTGSLLDAAAYPLSLYSLVGLAVGLFVVVLGALGAEDPLPAAVAGGLLVAGPLLAVLAGVSVPARAASSSVGLFAGTAGGYLLLVILLGAGAALGGVGPTGVLGTPTRVLAVVSFAVPAGALAVAAAYARDRSLTALADAAGD